MARFSRARGEELRGYFNWLYRSGGSAFTRAPNALLAETAAGLAPGKALDVAMGEGRNAVYLARLGWEVTGFDISDEALRQAQAQAERAGVRIRMVQTTCQAFDYVREQWDLLVLSYAFAPIQDPAYVARLKDSLKIGGRLVFEHNLRPGYPVPFPVEGAPRAGEARTIFAGFRLARYEETRARSDWAFRMVTPLVRIVGVKGS